MRTWKKEESYTKLVSKQCKHDLTLVRFGLLYGLLSK